MVEFTILSILTNLFTNLILSFILLLHKNRFFYYKLFNLNLIFWSFFYLLWVIVPDAKLALFFSRIDMIFVGLIPLLFFNFCLEYTNYKLSKFYKILNLVILLFFTTLMFTPLMIKGVNPFLNFTHAIDPGPLFIGFFLYFVINTILGLFVLFRQTLIDKKTLFVFYGTLLGFLGGISNFGICFHLPIPPYGNILITVYSIIIAYGILYHKVLDISFVFSKGIARVLTYSFFLITYGLLYYGLSIFNLTHNLILLSVTLLYIIFTWEAFSYINSQIQKFPDAILLKGWYDSNKLLLKIEEEVNDVKQKEKIFEVTEKNLSTALETENSITILISSTNQTKFSSNKVLLSYFQSKTEAIVLKNIDPQIAKILINQGFYQESVVLPFYSPGTLEALIILGPRKNKISYKQADFNFFKLLINNINSTLYRLTPYEKIEAEYKKALELASITKTVVTLHHEINSPLTAVLGCSAILKDREFDQKETKRISSLIYEQALKISNILKKLKNLINPVTIYYDKTAQIEMLDIKEE